MNKIFFLALFFIVTELLSSSFAQTTDYSSLEVQVEHGLVEDLHEDATLRCNVEANGGPALTARWIRNDEQLSNGDRIQISDTANGTSLTVTDVDYLLDLGLYHCAYYEGDARRVNASVELRASPYTNKFANSKNLVQEDTLTLRCDTFGFPAPFVVWYHDDLLLSPEDERVSYDEYQGVDGGQLKVKNMDYEDAGDYMCVSTNAYGQYNATILIRVKDKYAALWPFLGICAEVLVLCIIIFVYEKRRAKKMADEERKEEADHLTNSHAQRDDVRQRKV